jgi:hypothetical protein
VESISAVLDLFESRDQLLIASFPLWGGAARKLRATRGSPIVYDCHDLIEGFDNIDANFARRSRVRSIPPIWPFSLLIGLPRSTWLATRPSLKKQR